MLAPEQCWQMLANNTPWLWYDSYNQHRVLATKTHSENIKAAVEAIIFLNNESIPEILWTHGHAWQM